MWAVRESVSKGNLGYESGGKTAVRFMTALPCGVNGKESQNIEKMTDSQNNILQRIRTLLIQHIVFNAVSFKQTHI